MVAVLENTATDFGTSDPDTFLFGFTATSGRLLVIGLMTRANTVATPTGWTLDKEVVNSTENDRLVVWSKISDGTETSVPIDTSAADQWAGILRELSGVTQTSDATGETARTASVTSLLSGTAVTTTASTFLVAFIGKREATTVESWDSSFINPAEVETAGGTKARITGATRIVTITGSYSSTNSWTTSSTVMGVIVAYKTTEDPIDVEFSFGSQFK